MRAAIGVIILGLIMVFITAGERTGAVYKADSRSNERAAEQRGHKSETAKSEWFADPERGWIRVDERAQKDRERSRNENSQQRRDGILWEY